MTWIAELLSKIDYSKEYPEGKDLSNGWRALLCPFHEDTEPSLNINLANGIFKCHSCAKTGNFLTWAKEHNIDLKSIAKKYGINTKEKTISKKQIIEAHKALLKNDEKVSYLIEKRGYNLSTLKEYNIGWMNERYSIPIYDLYDNIINVRLYDPTDQKNKMISYGTDYGKIKLFPITNLYESEVFLFEGETDTLLALQMGLNAVTATTGATSWQGKFNYLFSGKKVYICYDIDIAGRKGAEKIATSLLDYCEEVKIIKLPLNPQEHPKGDFSDYILHAGYSIQDFLDLIKITPPFKLKTEENIEYLPLTLNEAIKDKYANKYIQFKALVSGKDIAPYLAPKKLKASCAMSAGKICSACAMNYNDGKGEREIEENRDELLSLIGIKTEQKEIYIKEIFDIPKRCNQVDFEITESYNIEEIVLIPEIDFTTDIYSEDKYVMRKAFFVGNFIEANKPYIFKGKTLPEPKTQYATHLLYEAKPSLNSVDQVKISDYEKFKIFNCDNPLKHYEKIYENSIVPATGIKKRFDMFLCMFLTFCSPLSFDFENHRVNKGWLETLILGDTRTGKTQMAKKLIEFFKLGELVLGESMSFAGLIGGLQQLGNRWSLNWGRIPLNDKRLVVVDEMSGLQTLEIAKLSGIRSSGIAEITKIITAKTYARTRLIWISNPRGDQYNQRVMMEYTQGVRAIKELIGKAEDISRFDLACLVSHAEVDMDIINAPLDETPEIDYRIFQQLILFCWKLKAEQIGFTENAMKDLYSAADKLGQDYTQGIPLVVPSEQRVKLAKIAVAFACITFNYKNEKIIVESNHVLAAQTFLRQLFDKPICGYNEYSNLEIRRNTLAKEYELDKYIVDIDLVNMLLDLEFFNQGDLRDIFALDSSKEVRELVTTFIKCRAINKAGKGYQKTGAFIRYLRNKKIKGFKLKKPETNVPF